MLASGGDVAQQRVSYFMKGFMSPPKKKLEWEMVSNEFQKSTKTLFLCILVV